MNPRTKVLLCVSAGIAVGIAAIPALQKWIPPAANSDLVSGVGDAGVTAPADEVVRLFLGALSRGDRDVYGTYLTDKARAGFGNEDGFQLDGEGLDGFETGTVSVTGAEASVPLTMTVNGVTQELSLRLRTEDAAWRIHGVAISMGAGELMIDFEGGSDSVDAVLGSSLESMGGALAQGMAQAIGESMGGALTEWEQGGSVESIAAERELFLSLEPLSPGDLEDSWRIDVSGAGRSVRKILVELLGQSDLELDDAGHAAQLDQPSYIELTGVSRVAAIEALCAEAQLVPVFPELNVGFQRTAAVLGFRSGPRKHAVALAGPFLIEVIELIERTPHGTGELRLGARALGLAPSALAASSTMGEYLRIDRVTGSGGSNLLAKEDVTVWHSPTQENGVVSMDRSIELRGLFSGVTSIVSIAGEVAIMRPSAVQTLDIRNLRDGGELALDGWLVKCTSLGQDTSLEIAREGERIRERELRCAPNAADGSPLGIVSQSAWDNGRGLAVSLSTPSAPASLTLKVFSSERAGSAFELTDEPLVSCAHQPAELTVLEFGGDVPLRIAFQGFSDRSNTDFPRIELAIENTSNKEVMKARATFFYLDASGAELESFPHDLAGELTFDGPTALSTPGLQSTLGSTAFFMPQETNTIRVRLDAVEFVDGSTWDRE